MMVQAAEHTMAAPVSHGIPLDHPYPSLLFNYLSSDKPKAQAKSQSGRESLCSSILSLHDLLTALHFKRPPGPGSITYVLNPPLQETPGPLPSLKVPPFQH